MHTGELGVKAILENTSWENFTLLLMAAKYNNLETFKLLLDRGCNLYSSCIKMQNSLHYAVINKNKEFIEFLTHYDAENEILLKEQNVRGQNPIEIDNKSYFENELKNIFYMIT